MAGEFEPCAQDIEKAMVSGQPPFDEAAPKFTEVRWSPCHGGLSLLPASWEDLMHAGLADCIASCQLESRLGIQRFSQG